MIITHPWLFNTIVVLFIAFTSGWIAFVLTGRQSRRLRNRVAILETEKEKLSVHLQQMEEQLQMNPAQTVNNPTPVISLSKHRINKQTDTGSV